MTTVSEKLTIFMPHQCMTNSTQQVTHIIFAEENIYVVTTDAVKVTRIYFNAVTVPAIYLRNSSNGHGTCQSTKA